jgi:hypothetical protein
MLLCTKNTYILELKLLLSIVTTEIETLVLGNKFLYSSVKEVAACELSHVLAPSINSSLLLKSCDHNQFFS